MLKLTKLFPFVFSLSIAFTESNPDLDKYRVYVTAIDPELLCIALSNNIIFYFKNDYVMLPEVGEEVVISAIPRAMSLESKKEGGNFNLLYSLLFSGDRCEGKYLPVWMPPEFEQYCLSYVSDKEVCVQEKGWFSSAIYQSIIELSDGSQWIINKDLFQFTEFKQGDHVMISKYGKECYIINVSQVRSFGYSYWITINPYIIKED